MAWSRCMCAPSRAVRTRFVRSAGARWPAWDTSGNLYYLRTNDRTVQMVPTKEDLGQLSVGTSQPVWGDRTAAAVLKRVVITVAGARFDVEAGGTRLLALESATADPGPELSHPIVVFGWAEVWDSLSRCSIESCPRNQADCPPLAVALDALDRAPRRPRRASRAGADHSAGASGMVRPSSESRGAPMSTTSAASDSCPAARSRKPCSISSAPGSPVVSTAVLQRRPARQIY